MATTIVEVSFNRFAELAGLLPDMVDMEVEATAKDIQADVQVDMAGPKSGRWYQNHRASAPGEAPAMDTGTLANSIDTERESPGAWVVYTNVDYAEYLEFGTVRMASRPAFVPAAERNAQGFTDRIADAIAGGFGG